MNSLVRFVFSYEMWMIKYSNKLTSKIILRCLGVLDACSGDQSWQTMLSIGILFAWEGHIFPCLFYQGYHVDYKTSKIGKICACLVALTWDSLNFPYSAMVKT